MSYIEKNIELTKELVLERKENGIDEGTVKRHKEIIRIFTQFANSGKLLEIGVREGFLFDHLLDSDFELHGFDISEEAIKRFYERGHTNGYVDDAQNFKTEIKFDVIVISHCLEHCPEPNKVVDCMYDALSENGIVYIEVPIQPKEPVPTPWMHYYCFSSMGDLLSFFDGRWEVLYKQDIKGSKPGRGTAKIVVKKNG